VKEIEQIKKAKGKHTFLYNALDIVAKFNGTLPLFLQMQCRQLAYLDF
jgi:hypothetical protein